MRDRTEWMLLCLWLVSMGCGRSSDPQPADCSEGAAGTCERLDDGCFADGRVVGLERAGEDCVLSLGTDTTGAWEQTLDGCEEGETAWADLRVDADVPEGATMRVSYRLMQDVLVPVGLPWTALDGREADLRGQQGRFLDVRVELRTGDGGDSPVLRGVSVGRRCAP